MKWIINKETDVVQAFLKRNGLDTKEKQDKFFNFGKNDFRTDFKDLDLIVKRLKMAVQNKEVITIYGDYDCDGISATVIFLRALKRLGIEANYIINNRFKEGYGMNAKGIKRLLAEFPDTNLVLSCDNGIAAQEAIKELLSKGIDVLVTDHHRQKGEIIVPTIDEWREDEDPEKREENCGAEIARKTMIALYKEMGIEDEEFLDSLIVFSGVATIADVVKFTPANRYIAKRGLELLKNPPFRIINLLIQMLEITDIDEETVGYQLAPLFNALSRVTGSPDVMVELLSKDSVTIKDYETVQYVIDINEQRKKMTDENVKIAYEQFNEEDECIIFAGNFDSGIAGLVCSKFVETYCKPCICLGLTEEGVLKGSARSYRDFDLKEALDKCSDLLLGYGGHAGAAGLSLKAENLQDFKDRMCSLVVESGILEEEPSIYVDYVIDVDQMYDENVESLEALAPFGNGFEKPNIAYQGNIKDIKLLPLKEENKKHVSFMLSNNKRNVKVLWWNSATRWLNFTSQMKSDKVMILGMPKISVFNGKESFSIILSDIKTN